MITQISYDGTATSGSAACLCPFAIDTNGLTIIVGGMATGKTAFVANSHLWQYRRTQKKSGRPKDIDIRTLFAGTGSHADLATAAEGIVRLFSIAGHEGQMALSELESTMWYIQNRFGKIEVRDMQPMLREAEEFGNPQLRPFDELSSNVLRLMVVIGTILSPQQYDLLLIDDADCGLDFHACKLVTDMARAVSSTVDGRSRIVMTARTQEMIDCALTDELVVATQLRDGKGMCQLRAATYRGQTA
jgi:hypothetical protein